MKLTRGVMLGVAVTSALAWASDARADVSLAGTRTVFSMPEPIELAVTGSDTQFQLRHADGSAVSVNVPAGSGSRLVTLAPNTLKPGSYTAASGSGAEAKFSVERGENANAYFTAQWVHHGGTAENAHAKGGWMYFNSDYVSLHSRAPKPGDLAEGYVAARMKPYALMILGGGHQLDLELANDWGDPWVQRAVYWRMNLGALSNRIYPMGGLHTYDEPGLTWWPVPTGEKDDKGNPKTEMSPYAIPHQLEEFKKSTGKEIPNGPFTKVAPQYATDMDAWLDFMAMRMKYLEQAWWANRWGTDDVHPAFTTLNQVSSSYAAGDVTDGVDASQARPYSIVSGHGGYSDLSFGTMQPVQSAEGFQGFTRGRPHYYLPMWYTHNWPSMRNAIWMSWTTKLEGMMYTPEQDFSMDNSNRGFYGSNTIFEVAEINRRLALVGDAMNKVPKTPAPVAVLLSHRQAAWDVAKGNNPEIAKIGVPHYVSPHRDAVSLCFWRVMENGIAPNWIDEEEAVQNGGSFLKQWKAIMVPRLTTISPALKKVLEEYIAAGGKLVQFKGDELILPGATISEARFGNSALHYKEQEIDKNPPKGWDLSWRAWNNAQAPGFSKELESWIGVQPYRTSNPDVLLGTHKLGAATYLLFANNAQSKDNPRGLKHELIPTITTVTVPAGGVIYDLFNGGLVPVRGTRAELKLPAGDGACWVHLPVAPGALKGKVTLDKGNVVKIDVTWGKVGSLPLRLRVLDPSGQKVDELFRATTPEKDSTRFQMAYPLGENAASGAWTVEVSESLTGSKVLSKVNVGKPGKGAWATQNSGNVSLYFEDARRIRELVAGKAPQLDYSKLNWDAKRVFGVEPKKFAVFGPEANAERIAQALRGKGMEVAVNPTYAIKDFVREPGRGGAGPKFRLQNYEDIFAHTIVLPGHDLLKKAGDRGHINRPETKDFPGAGRAYIQWGKSAYQAGWENVWVIGDAEVGTKWLLDAIVGKQDDDGNSAKALTASASASAAAKTKPLRELSPAQQIKTPDTPVGIASSADGKTLFALQSDGAASAYDASGKVLWSNRELMIGSELSLSPRGDRVAVAGYPGILVLDTKDGKVLGGYRAAPVPSSYSRPLMSRPAWNDGGTLVVAGWADNYREAEKALTQLPTVVLDDSGKVRKELKVAGDVMGTAFVPGTGIVLLGANQLTAVDTASGDNLWTAAISGAQSFSFDITNKQVAAGGWGKKLGVIDLADGKVQRQAAFDAIIGAVTYLPGGDLAVAVWGGSKPLYRLAPGETKGAPLFQSRFAFQDVAWSPATNNIVATEQGGGLWLLDAQGKPLAWSTDAGTTAYRMQLQGNQLTVGRMNRTVQRFTLKTG